MVAKTLALLLSFVIAAGLVALAIVGSGLAYYAAMNGKALEALFGAWMVITGVGSLWAFGEFMSHEQSRVTIGEEGK